MNQPNAVRSLFLGYYFGSPCTEANIRRAEEALDEPLPPVLRELYLGFDGFSGPTEARFFWPLFGYDGLVELNLFCRGDDLFPQELVARCVFFGDGGGGPQWGVKFDLPDKVIQWSASWGTDFEIVGDVPLDVWRQEKELYDSLSEM